MGGHEDQVHQGGAAVGQADPGGETPAGNTPHSPVDQTRSPVLQVES